MAMEGFSKSAKKFFKYIVLKRGYTIKQVGINLVYNIMVTARQNKRVFSAILTDFEFAWMTA